jgi:hypothetical protein
MCYEFESWHWKARAKELHKALLETGKTDHKASPAKPADEAERKRPEVNKPEKTPA